MDNKLLEIAVHDENTFVLLLHGLGGSQLRLNSPDCNPIGAPRVVDDVLEALKQAPERANAYSVSKPHERTDLHGNVLQAIQFYRVSEKLVE